MDFISQNLQDEISELLKPHRVCLVIPIVLHHSSQSCGKTANRFVVLSLWRCYLVMNKQPVRVETTFSYLEICSINIHSLTQIVVETDRQTLTFSVLQIEDLEAMVGHITASLKRIFPDSSPGKLLKMITSDVQQRVLTLANSTEEKLNNKPSYCGGFSDTYAALCDFNEMPIREEIQWDVDNIYYVHNWKQFNLQDFSHLDSRDLALAVAALSFNQWFTKICCKELKLSVDVQQQLTFLLSRSPSLEELSLEDGGLKLDFAVRMAAALQEHSSSPLQSINLSGNPIEDKGVIALSQELGKLAKGLRYLSLSRVSMTARGVGCLSQVLSSSQFFSASLTHLSLSGNPSSLATQEATFLFKFLSSSNCLSYLDLSDTNCPLDTLFVSLSAGCCYKLMHLNLARNPFSYRKVREVTRSIREFFSKSCGLKYVGLSGTKLPSQALRLLLQGLATNNTHLSGLELDISSCELRSAGAQVIQEHISEATAIKCLDISDNGFENDMVTLVLSVGRCHSLQKLALGRNFAMKSRALTDVLQRIAQLIQDDECPLQSLSVCDSRLKTGMHILLSALGSSSALSELDISGNNIGDTGAKMLAKALLNNTRLRTLTWDRNNVTARGYQDVADALERNFTLQQISLPLSDIMHHYRSNPDRTAEALHKIQQCLHRNNQRQSDRGGLLQVFRPQHSEKVVEGKCRQLEDSLQHLNHCSVVEVQTDVLAAHEVLHNARECFKLLPSLHEAGATLTCDEDLVNNILTDAVSALADEFTRSIQETARGLMRRAEAACPRALQRSSVWDCLSECMWKRSRQAQAFLTNALLESTAELITDNLRELRQTLSVCLAESITEHLLQELTTAQKNVDCLVQSNSGSAVNSSIPELRVSDSSFPTDEYSPAIWRNSFNCKSLRPAPSIKSLLDADWEQQAREGGGVTGKEGGGDERCGLPCLPSATLLSVAASDPSSSPSTSSPPSSLGWTGRRRREGKVAVVDAAAAIPRARGASFVPPLDHPLLYSMAARAPAEEAADCGGSRRQEAPIPSCSPSPGPLLNSGSPASPMEPLPTQGQTLRHYTASRPRPRRTHTQPPSPRPQEPVSKVENEAGEVMGRVDEGVEEFFTKKIIPVYALKGRWEESISVRVTSPESRSPQSAPTPFSSSSENITSSTTTPSFSVASTETSFMSADVQTFSTPSTTPTPSVVTTTTTTTHPSKNIKKKFGDFFAFKKARTSRAGKAGGGEGREGVKVKRTSIADLIRPLREAKDREKERERDKEAEKERGTKSLEDSKMSNDVATTEVIVATSHHLASKAKETVLSANMLTTTSPSDTSPSYSTIATSPDVSTAVLSSLEDEMVPVLTGHSPFTDVSLPLTEQKTSTVPVKDMKFAGSPHGERQLKVAKRSLREGKSQSLILLTGLESEDTHNKKHVSESSSSLEQRLQVMLQKIGMSKIPPADTMTGQKKDEELRKANSEGTILDKPEPPPTYMKPRTMSTSSDARNPMQAMDPIHLDPSFYPKPALPKRPTGPVPPKPPTIAKPPIPPLAASIGLGARPSSAPPSSSSAEKVGLRAPTKDRRQGEPTAQDRSQESAPFTGTVALPPALSPRRGFSPQSLTDEILPKPQQHMKPLPQRRAVSVHEDALAMTQELKAVLQRSPNRFRTNRGDLPASTDRPVSAGDAQRSQEDGVAEKPVAKEQKEEKTGRGRGLVLDEEQATDSERCSSAAQAQQEAPVSQLFSPAAALHKPASILERPEVLSHSLEKPPVSPTCQKKSPSTAPALAQILENMAASSRPQERTPSMVSAASGCVENETRNSTHKRNLVDSKEHTAKEDQRTEPPLSD